MESGFRLELDEQVVRFAAGGDDRGYLAALHLLDRNGVVDIDKIGSHAEALEYDRSGCGGAAALRAQTDRLAVQVLERFYVRSDENVELTHQQLGDVVDPLLDVSHPSRVLVELEGVGIGDRDVD